MIARYKRQARELSKEQQGSDKRQQQAALAGGTHGEWKRSKSKWDG